MYYAFVLFVSSPCDGDVHAAVSTTFFTLFRMMTVDIKAQRHPRAILTYSFTDLASTRNIDAAILNILCNSKRDTCT